MWATKNMKHIPHVTLEELLDILRSEGHYELPKSVETLLQTKRTNGAIKEMLSQKGEYEEYLYLGIKAGLSSRLKNSDYEKKIEVIVNIDGLPLFNKSDIDLIPILMQVFHPEYSCTPFVVALYCGRSKPHSINDFLNDFVDEASLYQQNGIEIENINYEFKVKCLNCDTPMRSFIKCTKGHTGFYTCERCETKGESVSKNKNNPKSKMRVFPEIDAKRRTKTSFKKQKQPEHHHPGETSPLLRIKNFDPVRGVLLDSMHLFCDGNMKYIMKSLKSGKKSISSRWKNENYYLLYCRNYHLTCLKNFSEKPSTWIIFQIGKLHSIGLFYCTLVL